MANTFIGRIKVALGLDSGSFEKGVAKSKQSVSGFSKFMKSTAGQITQAIGVAFAVDKIKDFAIEASKMAAEMEGVKMAFDQLNAPGLLDELRNATKGTVSDLELMKQAVSAQKLGLPVEQLGKYFEFARRTAKATGQSVDYLVNSIVTGIGRKSPLILDNLGISTVKLNEELAKTGDFGKAVGNIIEEEFGNMPADVDTTAEAMAQFGSTVDNLKTSIGNLINKGLILLLPVLTDVAAGFKYASEGSEKFAKDIANIPLDKMKNSAKGMAAEMVKGFKDSGFEGEELSKKIFNAIKFSQQLAKEAKERGDDEMASQYAAEVHELIKINKELRAQQSVKTELTDAQKKHLAEVNKLKEAQKDLNAELNLTEYKGIEGLGEAFKDALKPLEDLVKKIDETQPKIKKLIGAVPTESPLDAWAERQNQNIETLTQGIKTAMDSALNTVIDGFAAAVESGDMSQFGTTLLSGLADIMGQFGKMLIGLGLGMEALKESLALGPLGGAIAIAGGIALVAAASAIKGFLSNAAKGGGGGGGGARGGSVGQASNNPATTVGGGQFRTMSEQTSGGQNLRFVLEGKNLVAATNRYNTNQRLTT